MTRRKPPADRVDALARKCAALLSWLKGPGVAADPELFAARASAYAALVEAVGYLARGPELLDTYGALLPQPAGLPEPVNRPADSFTPDEVALLDEPVLTAQGWIVPGPLALHVDRVRRSLLEQQKPSTDRDALLQMLTNRATARGESQWRALGELPRLQTRLSRERSAARITRRGAKVPPEAPPE